jgi:cobalt-zinc-cadmium resistance protein CzcA
MLDKIIRFSIAHKLVIGFFTIALVVWGSYAFTQLPIDAVPDITNNQVQILTAAPSQAAQDIERLVTFPIEQSVATVPGIEEVRSFSRFGLSVVTVVFKEDIDVYWARQQISERTNNIKSIIPPEVGIPVLAPVSTGLGEIYQYVVRPKKGYESKYNVTELRTIQDWIIRRQLLGVEGVADVGSFGGKLKQYEITIDPNKLKSMNTSIDEVFNALQSNNQNTGGAYIDKKPNAYYIRSEGLITQIADIENIVVNITQNGIPVLIKNIATVNIGFATRYGAMTYNDQGEVAGAVVMMLKGANSSKVIDNVKERIAQIEKTLPIGLTIDPFLDRTKLVNNAINTVSRNLAEGALIVIFILVLFLGNMRAGLIVASVIPLAMLFAISLMNVFGVSGNLMSLGAIDFGLIIDGAVIIVESTMHYLGLRGSVMLTQKQMDEEVYQSASKIRTAAAFGEIIILIVYLPILALVGVEGKMFRPMAQTVSFAIIGAFLLSLTYVPMMSALFLSKNIQPTRTFSDKMMEKLHSIYAPVLHWSLARAKQIVIGSVVLFALSIVLFNTLGAEFIPALDEGDFAIETRILLGSSLTETVDAATKSAKVLLAEFPDEVKEVVSKIGSSEIPTDPMPIEACDLMVILTEKENWTKASTSNELADKMGEALKNVAGVNYGFQQPIQMRFNELMSGARQDVVIKIYGEDLEKLTTYAETIGKLITTTEGAKDVYVEKNTGLPQIVVKYKRDQLAKFGVSIQQLNTTLNAAFAGQIAGTLYEGEKRFDIVVRMDESNRKSLTDVKELYVNTSQGLQIPLTQLADVDFITGPNQIQRDDAKRRIIVGLNVRGRDVESIVKEIKSKMDKTITFEPGYFATFGGAFKNLEEARSRLLIAVPIALLLIFMLLYFSFHSVIQGLIIYTAIPLSAIGGIIALWMRDMPFSISAGVGFIALFGVAVLNGIVLLAEFNRLKKSGFTNIKQRILEGTKTRLRPVIMTATVASLGFLPMALSHGSGAEVQKPLATVVIGGLISATLLTLLVLPCLYYWVEKQQKARTAFLIPLLLSCLFYHPAQAQMQPVLLDSALQVAFKNNSQLLATSKEKEAAEYQKRTATELPKTDINLLYGQYNGFYRQDNNFTISQGIPFPGSMISKTALGNAKITAAQYKILTTQNELAYQVKLVYYQMQNVQSQYQLLMQKDTAFAELAAAANKRFERGDASQIEKMTSDMRQQEVQNNIQRNRAEATSLQLQLQLLLSSTVLFDVDERENKQRLLTINLDSNSISQNPYLQFLKQQITIAEKEKAVAVNSSYPDIKLGYFNQTLFGVPLNNIGTDFATRNNRFQGVVVGLSFPLWFAPNVYKSKTAETQVKASGLQFKQQEQAFDVQYKQAVQQFLKAQQSLAYYNNTALVNAALVKKQSQQSFALGEIGYTQHVLNLQQALAVQEAYIQTLLEYNKAVISIEFFTAK